MQGYTELINALRVEGIERLGRYYSVYPANVVDVHDERKQGRIKVSVPQLTDNQAIEEWAYPITPLGTGGAFLSLPRNGDKVWVMFLCGDVRFPVWLGAWWRYENGNTELPQEAQEDYPLLHVWQTPEGNAIVMNDNTGRIDITVRQGGGIVTIDGGNVYLNGADQFAVLGNTLKDELTKLDLKFDALIQVLQAWTPIPNDGGAALKTALSGVFALVGADFSSILSSTVKLK